MTLRNTLGAKLAFAFCLTILASGQAFAAAAKTTYPVVFAHGMAGFDDILGYDYWGDDYGQFVGDPCDGFLEVTCNGDLDSGQKTFIGQVLPFHNSEVRGLDLANDIEGYMATVGASYVNIIGHSQGGMDGRKASKVLAQRKGRQVVKVLLSVSSPHRGSPVAKWVLDLGAGVTSIANALTTIYGDTVYTSGNDLSASLKQLVYNDYSSTDGITTGAKAFNINNPISSSYAARYASVITAQNGLSVNPALFLVSQGFINIDGDGSCALGSDGLCTDGGNDGAAGAGNGTKTDLDDDGLVGINSQQMGYRLQYVDQLFALNYFNTDATRGNVTNINAPSATAMTSKVNVVNQDHIDVIGVGPDTFDEMEFYAAAIHYIATYD